MFRVIEEGKARIGVYEAAKVSKELPVFYNPVMKLNRDISIILLNSLGKKDMQIADPLAGSGIRAIRFLLELDKGVLRNIAVNDLGISACKSIKDNLRLNRLGRDRRVSGITNKDANMFLLESTGFDYIDIDPFGSPCPFLDAAITRLSRGGILAVTATDTSALAGSSKDACLRKYWAVPMRNELMHEMGIRILVRRVQLIGAQHEKALTPIFCYTDQHYYRLFFSCEKGRQKVDEIMREHRFFLYNSATLERRLSDDVFNAGTKAQGWSYAGPIWSGPLWDSRLVGQMLERCDPALRKAHSLLEILAEESRIPTVGFYDLHSIARISKRPLAKIATLVKKGVVARTHFLGWGIRTEKPIAEFFLE